MLLQTSDRSGQVLGSPWAGTEQQAPLASERSERSEPSRRLWMQSGRAHQLLPLHTGIAGHPGNQKATSAFDDDPSSDSTPCLVVHRFA